MTEDVIALLIQDFEKTTGAKITSIDIVEIRTIGTDSRKLIELEVKL